MYSREFMRFLINYQKDDFKPQNEKREIYFSSGRGGRLAEELLSIKLDNEVQNCKH